MGIARAGLHGVTKHIPSKAFEGYTMFGNEHAYDIWLIDMEGNFVHRWKVPPPCSFAYICKVLPGGNLMLIAEDPRHPQFGPLRELPRNEGGWLYELDWEGNVVWSVEDVGINHDFHRLDNANTIAITLTDCILTPDIVAQVKGGIPGTEINGVEMWSDAVVEINPKGEVVWRWNSHEHMDFDIDVICPLEPRNEWAHMNTSFVCPDGNILVSCRHTNSVFIIDKKTGDIIWRLDPEVQHQHDAQMLENGNIMIFDNGSCRNGIGPSRSRVIEVDPKTNKTVWQYEADPPGDFYSPVQGGCQRLPNGNTLICETTWGRIFEVTPDGEIVWEFVNPIYAGGMGLVGITSWIYRAYRYTPEYLGLKGMTLDPGKLEHVNQIYGPQTLKRSVEV